MSVQLNINLNKRGMMKTDYDFQLIDEGTIVLLFPFTNRANEWLSENVLDPLMFGNALAIEPRYANDIVNGLIDDDLTITL